MRFENIDVGNIYKNIKNSKQVKVFDINPHRYVGFAFIELFGTYVAAANIEDCPKNNEYLPKTFLISCYDLEPI